MPVARMRPVAAVAGGRIYAFGGGPGGIRTDGNSNVVQMYDPLANNWTMRTNMPTPRCLAAAVTVGDHIYVLGGISGAGMSQANEVYNAANNSWSSAAALPKAVAGAAIAYYNGQIYVLGGDSDSTARIQIYNPANNTWSTRGTSVPGFVGAGNVLVGSKMYIMGGSQNGFETSQSPVIYGYYDIAADRFTSIPAPSSMGFSFPSALFLNGKIYHIGGVGFNFQPWNNVYMLDIDTNNWYNNQIDLIAPCTGPGSAAIGDTMYIMGGASNLIHQPMNTTQACDDNFFFLLRKQ